MELYLKWKGFLGNKAIVEAKNHEIKYNADIKGFFSILAHIFDNKNNLILYSKINSWNNYIFDSNNEVIAKIKLKFSFVRTVIEIEGLNWTLKENFWSNSFHIIDSKGISIANIRKHFMHWDIGVLDEKNEPIVILISLFLRHLISANCSGNSIRF